MSGAREVYPGTAVRAGDSFTAADLLAVVEARAVLILKVAFVVMAATAIVLLLLPTLYSTSAEVTLDTRKNNVADQSAVLSALPNDTATLQNQIQILSSRDLASEVIAKLRLYEDPEFNGALARGFFSSLDPRHWSQGTPDLTRQRDAVITAFLSHLSVGAEGLSTSLTVTFTSKDPEKAARIANAIADTYVADQLRQKYDATKTTEAWLAGRITELAQQVQLAEDAAQKYRDENGLAEAADGTPLIDQQLAAINAQLIQSRADLGQKEATYARVSALRGSGDAGSLSQVLASPLIAQLRDQQADVIRDEAQMAQRYGPRHPKMIAEESERRDLEDKIAAEENRAADAIGNDVTVARGELGSLQAGLIAAEREAARQNVLRVKLRALEANAASTHATYETYVTRLRETQGQDTIQTADARVISHAPAPSAPTSPKRMLIFAASIPAGFLLGLLFALLAERFTAVRSGARARMGSVGVAPAVAPVPAVPARVPAPVAAQPLAAAQVLAEIPNASDTRAGDYVIDWPRAAFSIATARLFQRIWASKGVRAVVVSAADSDSGKTQIAVGLARAAALTGKKVVLIDADADARRAAGAMGLAVPQKGVCEVLAGQVPLARALAMDSRSNAFLLSLVRPVRTPEQLWASPAFAGLVAHLKTTCDLVVINAPPAGTAETSALARAGDGVVVVIKRTQAHEPKALIAVQRAAGWHKPLGVALSD